MSENFKVEIITPDQLILRTETSEVTIPSYEGQMGILKDHIPLITFLSPGLITIKENSGERKFFIEDGTVEFSNNSLLILTSTAKSLDSLEKNFIDTIIKDSQEKISKGGISDKERYLLSYKIDTLREINK